jgi:mannose-1-phosphate guanylyltransferase/mannose-6-phosphate isomerase
MLLGTATPRSLDAEDFMSHTLDHAAICFESELHTRRSAPMADTATVTREDQTNQLVWGGEQLIVPVILAGGSGTRLWPLSREMFPKQFVHFFGAENPSFFESTLERLRSGVFSPPIIVCNNNHRFLVRQEMERAGISPGAIILESTAHNTAAAIAVATLYVEQREPEAILAVMPSDHMLKDSARFIEVLKRAAAVAARGKLVLLGVRPTEAHTGYGYIRQGEPLDGCNGSAFALEAFVEKPDRRTAEAYIAAGYHWNSGIFVMSAQAFLGELARLEPSIVEAARKALAEAEEDLGFLRLDDTALAGVPELPIDRAVMEQTSAGAMLTLDCGWSDIGSWSSLWEASPRDERGNAVCGDALLEDTTGCYVSSENALVTTLGIHDLIIVQTSDALLVANKSRAQEISTIVTRLRQSNRKEYEQHLCNLRPWGYFETLSADQRFQVKLLNVRSGAKLSMQMHHHRSEHWTVVSGTAKVTIDSVEQLLTENESIYIPATHWHRLENPGKLPLEVIEVQIGSYLGEDDIIRSDDDYHRRPHETR